MIKSASDLAVYQLLPTYMARGEKGDLSTATAVVKLKSNLKICLTKYAIVSGLFWVPFTHSF